MLIQIYLALDVVISHLQLIIIFVLLIVIVKRVIFYILTIQTFMQQRLNVISLLIICASHRIKALLIKVVAQGIIVTPILLEYVESILVILALLRLHLLLSIDG